MKKNSNVVWLSLFAILFFSACATYYQKRISFQNDFAAGNLSKAKSFLEKNEKAAENKDRLLYFFDRGVVEQMLGNYSESNEYFEKAYIFHQDYKKNFSSDLGTYFVNPMAKPYEGEDFEVVLVHFYKALNYIYLNEMNSALIEARRINIQLNEFNTKYEDKKNRYKVDAFSHILMGLIFEAQREYNDAFIAYRNAYEAYRDVYQEHFNLKAPEQLKKDVLRMAKKIGFINELSFFEKEFSMQYNQSWENEGSDLIFFWLNGLGPVKGEFSLTLTKVKGKGGVLTFTNENEGISLPVPTGNYSPEKAAQLNDLGFVRLAIPKYRSRIPYYKSATIILEGNKFPLEKAEDINQIARSTLQDRSVRELGQAIGRLALKQATEAVAREQNQDIGAAISLINAATEKADTRNWQTLPYSISYQRIPLKRGENKLKLVTENRVFGNVIDSLSLGLARVSDTVNLEFDANKSMIFSTYHSLQSGPPQDFIR